MTSKGWKVIQAHVPMIKFRKGGNDRIPAALKSAAAPSGPGATAGSKSQGATGPNVVALPTIDHSQLPPRYQRRRLDSKEIAYINRGGPE